MPDPSTPWLQVELRELWPESGGLVVIGSVTPPAYQQFHGRPEAHIPLDQTHDGLRCAWIFTGAGHANAQTRINPGVVSRCLYPPYSILRTVSNRFIVAQLRKLPLQWDTWGEQLYLMAVTVPPVTVVWVAMAAGLNWPALLS